MVCLVISTWVSNYRLVSLWEIANHSLSRAIDATTESLPNQTTSTQPREKMNRHDSQLVLRGRIVGLKESGLSIRAIAHQLGISTSTVKRWTRRFEECGNLCNLGMYWNFVYDFYLQNAMPNNLCTNYSPVNVLSDPLHRISKDLHNYQYKVFQNSFTHVWEWYSNKINPIYSVAKCIKKNLIIKNVPPSATL